ncbi:DUF459 domain-containing protein [Actinoallomurus soli]|uniref:DUF459 domain-containing protein n=1 Tax=Actinoallomurus soli TaxID=2952535 RepID=UPI002092E87F|nr:SGNH hydrolase domain-containing protein [Actinoallomurus soli]MCO5973372.1 hypothetical protein [Actinoallomurus soli]
MGIIRSIGAGAVAVLLGGAAGCGHPVAKAPPAGGAAQAVAPPLGTQGPAPRADGLTVLVVGDSWARNLGVGMANAGRGRGYTVVNAAQGGCGIMLPTKEAPGGRLTETRPACRTWPEQWPRLVERYRPQAVVLYTAYWDQTPQVIDGGRPRDLGDPVFRQRYQADMDRAIGLLRAHGAAVFVGTAVLGKGAEARTAREMNRQVETVVQRNARRGVHLLDVRRQLCVSDDCPARIRGVDVYDETGHPTAPAHDRLGNWILTTLWTAAGHRAR